MEVAALLLAAGNSRRMGVCKQLLRLADRPAIVHCVDTLVAAGIGEIVVVVGSRGDAVAAAVAGYPLTVAVNAGEECEMADSVRTGLARLAAGATAVMVALADHPLVRPDTIRALVERHREEPDAIIIPVHDGVKGHPTLFPRAVIAGIAALPTLREVIARHRDKVRLVPVADEGVVRDMDVWEDYLAVAERFSAGS
ncbi:nucleotidyltransferase family protein [Geobacter pickeringii]|uniref:4-diphosphocytidyl-2C-methyl-D-erythritol kinase n=1 Tax=Geobacter pickeringii TaxID=345632 RepID=A0A0B5BG53_9BACT|nr:nucleotidyltransferase family protein [Geobacter pickeringii]AJE04114.1 4-diphosphocytidyl-2C-methyl-D-erythritol kinase [Geobacter pickeringii]